MENVYSNIANVQRLRYQSRQALRAQAEVMDVQTDMSLFDLTKIKKKVSR